MRFNAPAHPLMRIIFFAIGIFIIAVVLYELGPGVWPPNIASAFFLFIILGALSVAIPVVRSALFGWEEDWTIRRGEILIDQRNPFESRTIRFGEADMLRFDVVEVESSEGPNDWAVMLQPARDRPIEMRRLQSQRGADEFRAEVERAFFGTPGH